MSYLLEALQKSQKDRDQQLPNLQTPAIQVEVPDEAPRSPWIYIAVAALLVNTIVIVYLLFKSNPPVASPAMVAAPVVATTTEKPVVVPTLSHENISNTTAATTVVASVKDRISVQEIDDRSAKNNLSVHTPAAGNEKNVAEENTASLSPNVADTSIDLNTVPDVYELPFDIRAQLPELEMNSHIYSPKQADSFVMINNISLTPGAELSADLKLVAVTPDGAVLQFHDTRFLLPAMKSFKP